MGPLPSIQTKPQPPYSLVAQTPSPFGHHHQTQPASANPERIPPGQERDKDKLLIQSDTGFKGTPKRTAQLCPTHHLIELWRDYKLCGSRLAEALQCHTASVSCCGHCARVSQPAASCWRTSGRMAAGKAPLSRGRGSHPHLHGKRHLRSSKAIPPFPLLPSAPAAVAEGGGNGIYFIFCSPQEKEDFRGI